MSLNSTNNATPQHQQMLIQQALLAAAAAAAQANTPQTLNPVETLQFLHDIPKIQILMHNSQPKPTAPTVSFPLNDISDLFNKLVNKNQLLNPNLKLPNSLYNNKSCSWPECSLSNLKFDSFDAYLKLHLNIEHKLDDKSHKQLIKQIQQVESLELELNKQKQLLNEMLLHLNNQLELFKQQQTFTHQNQQLNDLIAFSQMQKSNNPNQDQENTNTEAKTKNLNKRSFEKASSSLGVEFQRNRELYKQQDIRPPFTYASLIRQSIIESTEHQLTLNEIYKWFEVNFSYFRKNAQTWKNAVRHNLSLHKCFMRVENVKGAVWTVDDLEYCRRRPLKVNSANSSSSSSPGLNQNNNNNNNQEEATEDNDTYENEINQNYDNISDSDIKSDEDDSDCSASKRRKHN